MNRDNNNTHEGYSTDIQAILLSYMITNPEAFAMSQNILRDDYFDTSLRPAAKTILDYATKFHKLPTFPMLKAASGIELDAFPEAVDHRDWYMETVEKFCRYKALEKIIMKGPTLLDEGRGAEIETAVREAQSISLMRDLGTNYFADPLKRLNDMKDRSSYFTTSWLTLDKLLYGGFTKGGLNIYAGGSGAGKSILLQNTALAWAKMGLNVIYLSLELSEHLVSLRLDAMTSGMTTSAIIANPEEAAIKVRYAGMKSSGSLTVKRLPETGTTIHTIRAYIREWEIQNGKKCDALVLDYLDLVYPTNTKIDLTNLFVKEKVAAEEVRSLLHELDIYCATASQLNRSSIEESEYTAANLSGSIGKLSTADNLIAIYAPPAMKDRGELELQLLKTRASAGVGQKCRLAYCPSTMLLTDKDENEDFKSLSGAEVRQEMKAKMATPAPIKPIAQPEPKEKVSDSTREGVAALMARIRQKGAP
jgi:KaiC/GvpD/RAD55 family RecA-like ATPase